MARGRPYSLAARLALVTAIWSSCALSLTGMILTELFRAKIERDFDARIEADLVNLVRDAAMRGARGSPALPAEALGPMYREPFSGWAWQVRRGDEIVAQSESLGPMIAGVMEPLAAPGARAEDFAAPGGIAARGAARQIRLGADGARLTFAVAGPRQAIDGAIAYFSRLLAYSLAIFGAVMVVASLLLARIMLTPVLRLKDAVRSLREGERLPGDERWPRELLPVLDELAGLNAHIGRLVERARHQASDLAHALKTPLSILRQVAETAPAEVAAPVMRELDRIDQSVDWHLTRRRLAGARHGRTPVAKVVDELNFAMSRLFESRNLSLNCMVGRELQFIGDEEDLQEMMGNLIENACKWARGRIEIRATEADGTLTIRIEDDGPGIAADLADKVFGRGARLDESAPGHGHGLAIVRDIVMLYGGAVTIGTAAIGGAAICLSLPGARAGVH